MKLKPFIEDNEQLKRHLVKQLWTAMNSDVSMIILNFNW